MPPVELFLPLGTQTVSLTDGKTVEAAKAIGWACGDGSLDPANMRTYLLVVAGLLGKRIREGRCSRVRSLREGVCLMASAWITTPKARLTKTGKPRYRVEFRVGGREARTRYGGGFRTAREGRTASRLDHG